MGRKPFLKRNDAFKFTKQKSMGAKYRNNENHQSLMHFVDETRFRRHWRARKAPFHDGIHGHQIELTISFRSVLHPVFHFNNLFLASYNDLDGSILPLRKVKNARRLLMEGL